MIALSWQGQTVYLLDDYPAIDKPVVAKVSAVTKETVGLSGRTARRPLASSLRWTVEFESLLSGTEAKKTVRNCREIILQPVLCPLWPFGVRWADQASIVMSYGMYALMRDVSGAWSIHASGTVPSPTPQDDDLLIPLLWGTIAVPEIKWVDAENCRVRYSFKETSDTAYAIAPVPCTLPVGPSLTGYPEAPKFYPFAIGLEDFSTQPDLMVIERQIGFGRKPLLTTYESARARRQRCTVMTATRAQCQLALYHFAVHSTGNSFWSQLWPSCARLTQDVAQGQTKIYVKSTAGLRVADWLVFWQMDGTSYSFAKIRSVNSESFFNTFSSPGPCEKDWTVINNLVLSKYGKPELQIEWHEANIATITHEFEEAPTEYTIPTGEQLGVTIGPLAPRRYLYEFEWTIGSATGVARYTSYEQDVTADDKVWTAKRISHKSVTSGLNLDRDEVTIEAAIGDVPIAADIAFLRAFSALRVKIYRYDTAVECIFNGVIESESVQGETVQIKAVSGLAIWDRAIPRMRLQLGCNHALFDGICRLNPSLWVWTGKVSSYQTSWPYKLVLTDFHRQQGQEPTFWEDWFAGGWIEIATDIPEVVSIAKSSVPNNGSIELQPSRPLTQQPAQGVSVNVWPGCDGRAETCKAYSAENPEGKFDNYDNFGGFPMIPVANPGLVQAGNMAVGGGKK